MFTFGAAANLLQIPVCSPEERRTHRCFFVAGQNPICKYFIAGNTVGWALGWARLTREVNRLEWAIHESTGGGFAGLPLCV